MIRIILSFVLVTSLGIGASLKAEPSSTPAKKQTKASEKKKTPILVPAAPLKEGWSLVNGVWMHSDGYKFVNGQVIRTGAQTHKRAPKPPTKAEMEAATKKKGPPTAAEAAAAKAAERERNLAPPRASQTGTHL